MKFQYADRAEDERESALLDVQDKAGQLFGAIRTRLIRADISESALSREIYDLAEKMYGIRKHWHKRVVRSGPNTLIPYAGNPPDRIIEDGDILFLDLGPVFEDWEADFGRTYVLGDDPVKLKLRDDVAAAFKMGKACFHARPEITGQEMYACVTKLAEQFGWKYGAAMAGHLIGEFPHIHIPGNKAVFYISPTNATRMNEPDSRGCKRHWILEIHFIDESRQIGAFYEDLLTVR